MTAEILARWWHGLDRPGWRNFAVAMAALTAALFLALFSGAAAQEGHMILAGLSALAALGVAGWVAMTIVPALARRTSLHWLTYKIQYKPTREGLIYLGIILVIAVASLNTGNNLLYMILASLLAGVLISGILSQLVLSGVDVGLDVPAHIFASQQIHAIAEIRNTKLWMPSFSVSLVSEQRKTRRKAPGNAVPEILARPVYFPYIPRRHTARQTLDLTFPRRGVYRQDVLGLRTRFPFGLLQKTLRVGSEIEALVYPPIQPTEKFYEVLPLVTGELESYQRGRGNDLYAIRGYQSDDSARHIDWKASAKTSVLQVREFAREDERRVMLAFDPYRAQDGADPVHAEERFERAVALCASLAWHFFEINSVIEFRSAGFATPRVASSLVIYDILQYLARVAPIQPQPGRRFLDSLSDAPDIFKIILTSQSRGSIPTDLWNSSFMLFISSL